MGVKVGYILEAPYPTFFVDEVTAVRRAGAEVVVFNTFRPFAQSYAAAESLRQESHYFPERYRGVIAANLQRILGHPGAYSRALRFALGQRLGLRLVALAAHYARVVEEQGVQHLHGGYGTTPATLAMLVAWLTGRPYSFTLHAYDVFLPNRSLPFKANGARFVTTISEFNREYIGRAYPSLDQGRLKVVRLGIDLAAWTPRKEPPENPIPECLCVAALIFACKGHDVLLRAVALLREQGTPMRCVLVGDGALRGPLEALVKGLGIGDLVEFAGRLNPDAVRERLRRADVFVLPAVVDAEGNHDGIPVALMEAMASGVPAVSTHVGGIPELVVDGVTGVLVPPGDISALAKALLSVTSRPALQRTLAEAARGHVLAQFDIRKTATTMVELFRTAPA